MLLRRLDLFKIAFACFLIGGLFYKQIPQVAPLLFEIDQGRVLTVFIVALVCFLAGEWLRNRWGKRGEALRPSAPDPNPQRLFVAGMILALSLFGLAGLLFVQRGVPMLTNDPNKAAAIKASLNIRTYGLTRVTDVFLPFLSVLCVGLSLKYSRKRHPKVLAAVLAGLTLAILFVKAGKANAVELIIGLLVAYDLARPGRVRLLSGRLLLVLLACLLVMVSIFYVTEGQEMVFTLKYLAGRVFVYSWEGFNFIVLKNLPPDLGSQLGQFFSVGGRHDSPDVLLARQMTQREDVPFAVVPTLFGFLYRNGGMALVAGGFLVLGGLVRSVVLKMEQHKDNMLKATAWYFTYLMLLTIFLVGNVFNEIRGMGATVLAIYLLFRFLSTVTIRTDR